MLERASIAGGATVAVVLVVIISIIFYTYVRQQRKEQRLARYASMSFFFGLLWTLDSNDLCVSKQF
jgi:uncharacterized membrane protein